MAGRLQGGGHGKVVVVLAAGRRPEGLLQRCHAATDARPAVCQLHGATQHLGLRRRTRPAHLGNPDSPLTMFTSVIAARKRNLGADLELENCIWRVHFSAAQACSGMRAIGDRTDGVDGPARQLECCHESRTTCAKDRMRLLRFDVAKAHFVARSRAGGEGGCLEAQLPPQQPRHAGDLAASTGLGGRRLLRGAAAVLGVPPHVGLEHLGGALRRRRRHLLSGAACLHVRSLLPGRPALNWQRSAKVPLPCGAQLSAQRQSVRKHAFVVLSAALENGEKTEIRERREEEEETNRKMSNIMVFAVDQNAETSGACATWLQIPIVMHEIRAAQNSVRKPAAPWWAWKPRPGLMAERPRRRRQGPPPPPASSERRPAVPPHLQAAAPQPSTCAAPQLPV